MADEDRNKFDRTSSNKAGVTLMNNQVGHVVADVMRGHDNVKVEELPSMIRIDGTGQFDFSFDEMGFEKMVEFHVRRGAGVGRLRER